MSSWYFLLLLSLTFSFPVMAKKYPLKHSLGQLAIKVAKASYFGEAKLGCGGETPVYDAGLCYKPCSKFTDSSWAFAKGVGSVCRGCPSSHPREELGLCYLDRGACPLGYRNDGLTCFRDAHILGADVSGCPWYDICGLTFARGCSTCPSGYRNDGCSCKRDSHQILRSSRNNRGIGHVMKTVDRGVGIPARWHYPPIKDLECKTPGWHGKAYTNNSMEMVMYRNDLQKIVAFGFRGADNDIAEWIPAFDTMKAYFRRNGKGVTLFRGLTLRYDSVGDWFEKQYSEVPSNYVILITGHSQGAAQATIGALFATARTGRRPDAVILWGSQQISLHDFNSKYEQIVGCNVTRNYINFGDFVSMHPLMGIFRSRLCGSVDIGAKILFDDKFQVPPANIAYNLWGDGGYEDWFLKKYTDSPRAVKYGCDLAYSR